MNHLSRLCGPAAVALLCLMVMSAPAPAQKRLPGRDKEKPAAPARDGRVLPAVVPARPLIISEFRLNGTNGANDEFIEIYNASNAAHTVNSSDGSATGYGVAASDGALRFTIPQNTVIPARGHYLGCNSVGYSLTTYPSGNNGSMATTATCDATYTANIPNGEDPDGAGPNPPLPRRGIALFSTATPANFNTTTKLDAVGPTEETNTLYKEGTGVRNLSHFATAHSYVRRLPGGCIGTDPDTVDANCTNAVAVVGTPHASSAHPQDTDNNRDDFIFVDTNGTPQSPEGTQQRLGAPGPENSTSPINRSAVIPASLVFPCEGAQSPPNQQRDFTQDTANESFFGTLEIRRKFTNKTGASITRLRLRVVDITVFPSPAFAPLNGATCGDPGTSCAADLRPRSSLSVTVANPAACGGGPAINVQGTTLEEAASFEGQPNSGGYNSSLSAGTVTLNTPLANNASINLRILLGVQQKGVYRVFVTVEALP